MSTQQTQFPSDALARRHIKAGLERHLKQLRLVREDSRKRGKREIVESLQPAIQWFSDQLFQLQQESQP